MQIRERGTRLAVIALLAMAPLTGGFASAETTGRIDLFAGQRMLDSDFEPADDPTQLGATLSMARDGWPVMLTLSVFQASDDGTQPTTFGGLPVSGSADLDLMEIDLGVRRYAGDGPWLLHYGGGLAYVDAEVESTISDTGGVLFTGETNDDAFGLWLSIGGSWEFNERFQAGIDLRYTDAEVDLGAADDFEAGGTQLGLTIGYRW